MAEYNDPNDALNHWISSHLADSVNTALECVVVAYKAGRVDVKPIGTKNYTDGDSTAFPVLYDLPLHWPQGDGGLAGVKVPIKAGDKCLAIFAQQPQTEADAENTRRFSIADGYVVPGCSYDDAHAGNDSLRLYYGEAFIEITSAGKININAPGGIEAKAPLTTFTQAVTVKGMFTFAGGATGSGGGADTVTINGKLVVTDGNSTFGGKSFLGHQHANGNNGNNTGGVV